MICNIVDKRKKKYRWKNINAIIEPTWHDNTCQDTDIAPAGNPLEELVYDQKENASLLDAVKWASELPELLTLYLYDEGEGTKTMSLEEFKNKSKDSV